MGHRESLLSFIGGDLVAVRWKQWRLYFTDIHPTGTGPQRQPGPFSASAPMAGYPKGYNIEMDPHEDLVVVGPFAWVLEPALKVVEEYLASVKRETQYFEMFANRGIYHDGWYACTTPPVPPWLLGTAKLPEINDYKWELYNIADDYSQNNDLAASNPDKLHELQALFLTEAARYEVCRWTTRSCPAL
jgi:hypothetical protein